MDIKKIDKQIGKLKATKSLLAQILENYAIDFTSNVKQGFETDCTEFSKMKVAAVMDPFTVGNFRSECELFEITSDDWFNQLEECKPDLFFLESTWHGKNDSWFKKVSTGSKELYEMTDYCHEKGIPVIFWNKEDPVHTDVFMAAASCADYVFTTDIDCIERYVRTLKHKNVYFLTFSAQPMVHNPIEIHNRKDKFCYAGTYFHRYKERSRVFDSFANAIEKRNGMEIYDRNYGSGNPQYAFPVRYNKMIMGNLKPEDIHIAYKGYNYGINTCTVSQSQTMFARRGYELLASNTVTVGNFSLGVKNILGDLVISTDDANEMIAKLDRFCATDEMYRKYRLAGLREVMKYHLCEDRLGYITEKVFRKNLKKPMPCVTVVSSAETSEDKDYVTAAFKRQTYDKKQLVFINEASVPADTDFVAAFSADDYYGENYLTDLILSVRYSDADGFGKLHYYTQNDNQFLLNGKEGTYKPCSILYSTRCIAKTEIVKEMKGFAAGMEIKGNFLAVDEFNYCADFKGTSCEIVDDLLIEDKGISLDEIERVIKIIKKKAMYTDIFSLSAKEMNDSVSKKIKTVETSYLAGKFKVLSSLPVNEIEYIHFKQKLNIFDFKSTGKIDVVFYGAGGDLSSKGFCIFYNSAGEKIATFSGICNRIITAEIPEDAETFSLALEVTGRGLREFTAIVVSGNLENGTETPLLTKSNTLVISDYYPSYSDRHIHASVHERNKLYAKNNISTDTMCISMRDEPGFREFEGITITNGGADRIVSALKSEKIKTVSVHFMNSYIWNTLRNYLENVKLIIWYKGIEKFTSETDEEESKALWNEIFSCTENNDIHFVFDSDELRKTVEESYNISLGSISSVISDCTDSDIIIRLSKNISE